MRTTLISTILAIVLTISASADFEFNINQVNVMLGGKHNDNRFSDEISGIFVSDGNKEKTVVLGVYENSIEETSFYVGYSMTAFENDFVKLSGQVGIASGYKNSDSYHKKFKACYDGNAGEKISCDEEGSTIIDGHEGFEPNVITFEDERSSPQIKTYKGFTAIGFIILKLKPLKAKALNVSFSPYIMMSYGLTSYGLTAKF